MTQQLCVLPGISLRVFGAGIASPPQAVARRPGTLVHGPEQGPDRDSVKDK